MYTAVCKGIIAYGFDACSKAYQGKTCSLKGSCADVMYVVSELNFDYIFMSVEGIVANVEGSCFKINFVVFGGN